MPQLESVAAFAATVLHEVSHAFSDAPDVSLEFEEKLTQELGTVVARQLGSSEGQFIGDQSLGLWHGGAPQWRKGRGRSGR
jgi:hypothetical protein